MPSPSTQPDPTPAAVKAVDALREELGLTVPDLAALIERDRTHLWRVFANQVTATPDVVSRCLIALGEVVRDRALVRR